MRTGLFILAGVVLWTVCIGAARLVAAQSASAPTVATAAFVAVWLVAASVNMWIGVSRAGYTVREELPIFLVFFLIPAAVAVVARWKFL